MAHDIPMMLIFIWRIRLSDGCRDFMHKLIWGRFHIAAVIYSGSLQAYCNDGWRHRTHTDTVQQRRSQKRAPFPKRHCSYSFFFCAAFQGCSNTTYRPAVHSSVHKSCVDHRGAFPPVLFPGLFPEFCIMCLWNGPNRRVSDNPWLFIWTICWKDTVFNRQMRRHEAAIPRGRRHASFSFS